MRLESSMWNEISCGIVNQNNDFVPLFLCVFHWIIYWTIHKNLECMLVIFWFWDIFAGYWVGLDWISIRLPKLLGSQTWPLLPGWKGLLHCVIMLLLLHLMPFNLCWKLSWVEVLVKCLRDSMWNLLALLQLHRYFFYSWKVSACWYNRGILYELQKETWIW